MPLIRTIRPRMLNPKPLPKLSASGDVVGDFPVVVVVDSGVSDAVPELESWVVGRDSQVAPQYQTWQVETLCSEHKDHTAGNRRIDRKDAEERMIRSFLSRYVVEPIRPAVVRDSA